MKLWLCSAAAAFVLPAHGSSSSSSSSAGAGVDDTFLTGFQGGCEIEHNVDYNGNDLTNFPTPDAASCCTACSNGSFPDCAYWSWNGPNSNMNCYLKTSDVGRTPVHGVVSGKTSAPPPPSPKDQPWFNTSLPIPKRVSSLVQAMTLSEKAAQLQTSAPAIPRLGVPTYAYWSEAAHGVAWAGRATVFPCSLAMAAAFDAPAMFQIGRAVGLEGRAKYNDALNHTHGQGTPSLYGLTFFAPNINIVRDVRWGRGQETYGEDPTLTAKLAVQYIAGMQSDYGGYPLVAATSKHYFAYNLESNFAVGGSDGQYRLKFDANVSDVDLRQTYLPAFEATVDPQGESPAAGVMCSYNSINGVPACGHPYIKSHLRGSAGFDGWLVSDCGAVGWMGPGMHNYTEDAMHSAALFTNAGGDVCCGGEYAGPAVQAVAAGILNETTMDAALGRALSVRFRLGMFDPPSMVPASNLTVANSVDTSAKRALARRIATEGIVLLRNQPQKSEPTSSASKLLPISSDVKTIAVIGPNANRTMSLVSNYPGCKSGPGSALVPECTLVNPLQGIEASASTHGSEVTFSQGCDIDTQDTSGFAAALAAAKAADAVVFVGGIITCQEQGDQCQEAEAKDRVNVTLPGVQEQLLRQIVDANPATVLVVESGATVSVPFAAQNVPAVVQMFYPGEEGGHALGDILFGDANPSGRLPETVVTGLEQLSPKYLSLDMTDAPGRTHRYLTETPLYAFGFGLSYSRHTYGNLSVSGGGKLNTSDPNSSVHISAQVQISDGPAGDEVVQLYTALSAPANGFGNLSIPVRELKAFERVAVPAVGGDSVAVTFTLTAADLALVDVDGVKRAIEGTYDVWVGGVGPGAQGKYVTADEFEAPLHTQITVVASS